MTSLRSEQREGPPTSRRPLLDWEANRAVANMYAQIVPRNSGTSAEFSEGRSAGRNIERKEVQKITEQVQGPWIRLPTSAAAAAGRKISALCQLRTPSWDTTTPTDWSRG
ncbi:hypothetical protein Mapa_011500 [Marchantia paleacea]|nr:hypothetical protein Mapa_011500 [Marchantia paleacea]